MLPSTPEYYCFLVLIFLAFWSLGRFRLACMALVCAANLFFYAKWGLIYLILIPCAATCDFLIGRAMARSQSARVRRLLDSFALTDMVTELKQEFGLMIPDADLSPRRFESIARIEHYLDSRANT